MRNKKIFKSLIVLILITWLISDANILSVKADGLSLAILPETSLVSPGSPITLDVVVQQAVNMNACDISLEYDPQLLFLQTWSHGGFLQKPFIVTEENKPGFFRLAVSQLASPPVNGNGVLVSLVFETLSAGSSAVTISQATIAESNGNAAIPELSHGTVVITHEPMFTIMPTSTIAPTAATQTVLQSPTPPNTSNNAVSPTPPTPISNHVSHQYTLYLPWVSKGDISDNPSGSSDDQHYEPSSDADLYLPMVSSHDSTEKAVETTPTKPKLSTQTPIQKKATWTPSQTVYSPDSTQKSSKFFSLIEVALWTILLLSASGAIWLAKSLFTKPRNT